MTDPVKLHLDTTIIDIEGEVVSSLTVTHTEDGVRFDIQIDYPDDDDATRLFRVIPDK